MNENLLKVNTLNHPVINSNDDDNFILNLSLDLNLEWEDAAPALEPWLLSQGFEIQELIKGADRLNWRLLFDHVECYLYAEFLTSSYWFESADKITLEAIKLGLD